MNKNHVEKLLILSGQCEKHRAFCFLAQGRRLVVEVFSFKFEVTFDSGGHISDKKSQLCRRYENKQLL